MDRTTTAAGRYAALSDEVFDRYGEERFADALAALDAAPAELEPWQAELAHLRACVLGRLDQPARALEALETAQAAGGWWAPDVLTDDDDLAALAALPGFEALVERSAADWAAANAELDRTGDVLVVPETSPRGVVVALHGAEQDATDAADAWRAVVDDGWALLAVRSSQRTSPRYRSWPDEERARAEVAAALDLLPAALRDLPRVAAGFSAGGRVALRWALTAQPVPVAGVVVAAPAMDADLVPAEQRDLAPAVLLVGERDDLLDDVRALAAALPAFALEVVPAHGHAVPEDAAARVSG